MAYLEIEYVGFGFRVSVEGSSYLINMSIVGVMLTCSWIEDQKFKLRSCLCCTLKAKIFSKPRYNTGIVA